MFKRATTKELNEQAHKYIINAIEDFDYNDYHLVTPAQKVQFVYATFRKEKDYEIKRIGEYSAFRDWLMGLPSCINIDFENQYILQIARKWGSIPIIATERQEQKILDNWFNFITVKFFQLAKKLKAVQ